MDDGVRTATPESTLDRLRVKLEVARRDLDAAHGDHAAGDPEAEWRIVNLERLVAELQVVIIAETAADRRRRMDD